MKSLYFDLSCGASGDMILSALIDLGASKKEIYKQLSSLPLPKFEMETDNIDRNGIRCKQLKLKIPHEHEHRHLSDIVKIINDSKISPTAKERSVAIFNTIAMAEAKVHNVAVDKVHFHEVGAMDSILDIVGACIAFDLLGVTNFYANTLTIGTGTIKCAHGVMPVPAPATTEIIKGHPSKILDTGTEILTPTGAGIITTLATKTISGDILLRECGYGTGTRKLDGFSNLLRIWIGETANIDSTSDSVLEIKINVDDCTPEILGYTMEKLMSAGALDVYFTPIFMKKNRPAYLLSVICNKVDKVGISNIIFKETSSIGIRFSELSRIKLQREEATLLSPWGELLCKKIITEFGSRIAPEFEACRQMALKKNIPLQEIYTWVTNQNVPN